LSKGSAFVKFEAKESADKALVLAETGIIIKDRKVRADLAVDKDKAAQLSASEKERMKNRDKRNLYLANEGLVVEKNNDQGMSDDDREKRRRAQTEKRKKLQNPLFFVSANRLNIRNIAKTVTDQELKGIILTAVKAGIDKKLVSESDLQKQDVAKGLSVEHHTIDPTPAMIKKCITSSKIMLDMTRLRGGAPQSRGFAFVEFSDHLYALLALRELNNNPRYRYFLRYYIIITIIIIIIMTIVIFQRIVKLVARVAL